MKTFYIKFSCDGEDEPRERGFKATSPGHAFAKCVRKFPAAKLIKCWNEGGMGAEYGRIVYEPPSTVGVVAEPEPKAEETKFPFYDDCRGRR